MGTENYPNIFNEKKKVTFNNVFNGVTFEGDYFISDFTKEEIKLLRRKQRYSETRA